MDGRVASGAAVEVGPLHVRVVGRVEVRRRVAEAHLAGDASDAIDNMHNSELFGRVLRVNLAKPDAMTGSSLIEPSTPIDPSPMSARLPLPV